MEDSDGTLCLLTSTNNFTPFTMDQVLFSGWITLVTNQSFIATDYNDLLKSITTTRIKNFPNYT